MNRLPYVDIQDSPNTYSCFNCNMIISEGSIMKGNVICENCSPICVPSIPLILKYRKPRRISKRIKS